MSELEPFPLLSAKTLSIGYHEQDGPVAIAEQLDLSLWAGEFVCLLGPNGIGKSTLIRTFAGMQPPLSGEMNLSAKPYASISPRERARLISVVLTESFTAGMMDAYTFVSLGRHPYSGWFGGLDKKDQICIERAFDAVGATPLMQRQVAELSDGERQKVSIARALAQETRVMLLDEPTAFLDLPRRVELMTLLRDLAHREKMALLLSTHDLDLALRFADRLWVISTEGRLIQGYPEAIAMNGDLAKIFKSEKLDWDAAMGNFRTHPTPCLYVHIEGEGIEAVWTRRALERFGFGIADKGKVVAFSLQVTGSLWKIEKDGARDTVHSIEGLIDWICETYM